jgi:hypothetical protein
LSTATVALRELSDTTFNFPTRADAYEYAYDALRRLEAKPTHSQERGAGGRKQPRRSPRRHPRTCVSDLNRRVGGGETGLPQRCAEPGVDQTQTGTQPVRSTDVIAGLFVATLTQRSSAAIETALS